MKKNSYYISYFPLLTIMLYSVSFGFYFHSQIMKYLVSSGMLSQLIDICTEKEIRIALFIVLFLFFFMVLASLKVTASTLLQVSLLFFSRDSKGNGIFASRTGSIVYIISSVVSLFFMKSIWFVLFIFLIATCLYFTYYMYQVSEEMSIAGIFGAVMFQFTFWMMFSGFVAFVLLAFFDTIFSRIASEIVK